MATYRIFAYNPTQTPISGTTQVGDLAISSSDQDYSTNPGGVRWWAGPDEDLGYVVALPNAAGDQPTNVPGVEASLQFWRSSALDDASFIGLCNMLSRKFSGSGPFATAQDAQDWIDTNGWWSSWETSGYVNTANIYYDPGDSSSYSGSGTSLINIGTDGNVTGTSGTLSGVTYEAGTASGTFNFDGGTDKITFGQYNFGDDFTFTAWVYPRAEYSINCLASNCGANTATAGFKLGWNNWNTQNLRMNIEAGNGSSGGTVSTSTSVITENVWQHIAYVINRGSQSYRFYVNGVEQGNNGILLPNNFAINNANWWMGSIGGNSYYMDANVGQFRVYKSLRSTSELFEEYNATKTRYGL